MNFYVEIRDGFPFNTDGMCAIEGAQMLGHGVKTFTRETVSQFTRQRIENENNMFVGSIDSMKEIFGILGRMPKDLDFPPNALERPNWLKRTVRRMKVEDAWKEFERTGVPMHVKPVETKLFDAQVLHKDAKSYFWNHFKAEAWVSDVVKITAEWRAFVHHGRLVDFRQYAGSPYLQVPPVWANGHINTFEDAPCAYVVDIGKDDKGDEVLIEYGDFWAVGSYGLEPALYAQMLIDRFNEIRK